MGFRNFLFNKTGICLKKTDGPFAFNELSVKNKALSHIKKLEILALGSSHGAYSFIPKIVNKNSFNLCSTSQDLYYSYQLYKKVSTLHPELRTVILFYSVFSSGFELEKTKEKSISAYFMFLYKIKSKFNDDSLALAVQKIKMYKNPKNVFKKIDNGFLYHKNKLLNLFDTNDRVKLHLRENRRENNQVNYLLQLINDCNKDNKKLIVILSPARSDYKQLIPNNAFYKIIELKKQYRFELIDLFNSDLLDDNDFFDCDHLDLTGAIRLSNYLKDYL